MNSKVFKSCGVSLCKNSSIKTPSKLFVNVPKNKIIRDKWLSFGRLDPAVLSKNAIIYFCEDHFDMPNDMENYMEYYLMGSVPRVRMKPGCCPTKMKFLHSETLLSKNLCLMRETLLASSNQF